MRGVRRRGALRHACAPGAAVGRRPAALARGPLRQRAGRCIRPRAAALAPSFARLAHDVCRGIGMKPSCAWIFLCAAFPAAANGVDAMTPAAQRAYTQVVTTRDNASAPFIVIDKVAARLWVFDARGDPRGSTPVLLGAARGDRSVPGIGTRPIAQILPHERTTPAGRFVAEPGRNADGEDVIWIDYDAAVSMHRVRATNPRERRLERLATSTPRDNRISYGCINVPAAFYERWLGPLVLKEKPVVYVLAEEVGGTAVASFETRNRSSVIRSPRVD